MWCVYWDADKNMYQLSNKNDVHWVAMFRNFDMAYDYVTKANKTSDVKAYSRWTVAR